MLSSRVRPFAILGFALLLSRCGGNSGDTGSVTCGDAVCGEHQRCDQAATPSCVCEDAYTGEACDVCAPGYSAAGATCAPTPIDCDNGNPCGSYGACVESGSGDHCECMADHAGRTCAQCADGLQDNDGNGTCTEACSRAELACASWEACDDSSGTVTCGCSPHSTGRHCDECASGYYRLADGPCVSYCGGTENCAAPKTCQEVEGEDAACACPVGSTGDTCTTCSAGFTAMTNGACGRNPTAGHLLLGSKDMNRDVLCDYDPATKAFIPLRSGVPGLLSSDRTKHELWAGETTGNGASFGRYDLASGAITALSASHPFNSTATFDPSRRAVFWVVPDDLSGLSGKLTRFDVDSGAETTIAPVQIRSSDYMTYDGHNDRLIGTQWNSGLELVAIDPDTGALASLGKPNFENNFTNPRVTVDDAGQIYLLSPIQRSPEEGLRDMLIDVFVRLGLVPPAQDAPVTLTSRYYAEPSMPVTLAATKSSGAELVAYDSHGDKQAGSSPEPTPVTVGVKNPDAVVSITSLKEKFQIQIPADAKFKTLYVYGSGAHTLDIAPGFAASASSIVMIGSNLEHDALEALSPAVRAYTSQAVSDRRAPVDVYYDETDDEPPLWLVRVDPTTMAATLVQRMPEREAAQALTVY